jgi:hypothetical protein
VGGDHAEEAGYLSAVEGGAVSVYRLHTFADTDVGITQDDAGVVSGVFVRFLTALGPTDWREIESGDSPFADAVCELVRVLIATRVYWTGSGMIRENAPVEAL